MDVLITEAQIQSAVRDLARRLREAYAGKPLTVLGVMTGSLFFLTDLVRELDLPLQMGVLLASSYKGPRTTPGELQINDEFLPSLAGREVLVVDDIFDTGHTLSHLLERLKSHKPAGIRSAVLLWKTDRRDVDLVPDFHCFQIPDRFVVGYGLDFNNDYRHLRHIAALDPPPPV